MTAGRENVDGYVIPFVFPDVDGRRADRGGANRAARIAVYPTDHGWRAALRNCQDHAETAEQARAFAAAWIRAAEVLENVAKADELRDVPQRQLLGDGQVVDCEVVDDDEDQDAANVPTPASEPRREWCCGTPITKPHTPGCSYEPREDNAPDYGALLGVGKPPRLPGEPKSPLLAESDPPVALHPDDVRPFAIGERVRVTDRMSDHHDRIGTVIDTDLDGDIGVELEADPGRCAHITGFKAAHLRPAR